MTRTVLCTCAALAALWLVVPARSTVRLSAQEQGATALAANTVIEHELARGQEYRYALALAAGEHVRVAVEQRGIDVIVQTRGADGRVLADFADNITNHGQEQAELVADAAGTYIVAVKAAPGIGVPGSYAIRIVNRRPATDDDRAAQEVQALCTRATRLDGEGRFDAARALLERALTITEAHRGPDDLQAAVVAAQLAGVYRNLPDDARSEALSQRAIAIMDTTLGADHPTTAFARSRLALLYQKMGQRAKAGALLQQAMAVIEKTIGSESRWFVSCLMTQASLSSDAGDVDQEREVIQRAMTILEDGGDAESSMYASLLNNLGEVYRLKEDYPRAEELYKRSLAIGTAALGEDNYFIATALQNLGVVARERKDYATAAEYYTRALSIRERVVGPNHPTIAQLLNNLAIIYRATGDNTRSIETHLRALHIWEHAAGPYQQATLVSVGNIARTYAAFGDIANAVAYQRRADAILEEELALNLAIGSERQKLTFVKSMAERTDRTISLHVRTAPHDADAAALAALVVLQRKGRVLDAMIDTYATLRQRLSSSSDQALFDRLRTTTADLARLALSAPDPAHQGDRPAAVKELEARKDRLEAELAAGSAEFRAGMLPVTLGAVQAAMPEGTALLEFAVFRPFDPTAERNAEAYGPPHYAAYVVRKYGTPQGVDLGEAEAIDKQIAGLRQRLRDPARTDLKQAAREVDELVMRPVRASFADATQLLISPDGDLHLVPFEALVDEHGGYLIEHYAVNYVTSGRDLLRMQVTRANRSVPVIFADPLFGEPATTSAARPASGAASSRTARRSATTGDDLSSVYFAPLAASGEEARAIKALFPEATLLTGDRATKGALQRVEAPRILHIASHGFFLQDTARGGTPIAAAASGARAITAAVPAANPLLRSGLALAGANLPHDRPENGILTALEASGLDLWGTKLVTLSACDTGVGEVRNGEGVYGLRRAFVLAGTETLVMSLWPVSDYVARETMVAYYTGLRAGLGRGDALRQAKLAMLKRKGRQHPFYWASFVQSGEWANLDGKR